MRKLKSWINVHYKANRALQDVQQVKSIEDYMTHHFTNDAFMDLILERSIPIITQPAIAMKQTDDTDTTMSLLTSPTTTASKSSQPVSISVDSSLIFHVFTAVCCNHQVGGYWVGSIPPDFELVVVHNYTMTYQQILEVALREHQDSVNSYDLYNCHVKVQLFKEPVENINHNHPINVLLVHKCLLSHSTIFNIFLNYTMHNDGNVLTN